MESECAAVEAILQQLGGDSGDAQAAVEELRATAGLHAAAKLQLALAYSANALFFAYLRAQGVDPSTHPVQGELERIKGYVAKYKAAEAAAAVEAAKASANSGAADAFLSSA